MNDEALRAAARDACARWFGSTEVKPLVATPPWDDARQRHLVAEITKWCDEQVTRSILRVESHARDWLVAKFADARASTSAHDPIGALLSIPIVLDDSLPEGTWRLVSPEGHVLYEGTVSP